MARASFAPIHGLDETEQLEFLDRTVETFSGGETVSLALTALLSLRPDLVLLDEPTNNLDTAAKAPLFAALQTLPCSAVVVSHDRDLLSHMHEIAELYRGNLRFFTGNYKTYRAAIAAEHRITDAKSVERREVRQRAEMLTRLAR